MAFMALSKMPGLARFRYVFKGLNVQIEKKDMQLKT